MIGPLNGVRFGDIVVDRKGHPWCYHSLCWEADYPFSVYVTAVRKQNETVAGRSRSYPWEPQVKPQEGLRIASPLELLALVEEGYVLNLMEAHD